MPAWLERIDAWLQRPARWWSWPLFLVVTAVLGDVAALLLQPLGDAWVAWPWGGRFGDTCAMITATGLPCPNCGMTRAWVHGIRGHLFEAWWYNPAGLVLFFWMNVAGVFGALRLWRRDPTRAQLAPGALFVWVMLWFVVLYLGGYVVRLAGFMPLP